MFAAHKSWSQYIYGSAPALERPSAASLEARGGEGEPAARSGGGGQRERGLQLDSVLQRIDFGPPGCLPEGVVAAQSPMWPLNAAREHLLSLLQARVRAVFGPLLPWNDDDARADMIQFTQMRPSEELAPHVDSRDRWAEGIASIAWGQVRACPSPTAAKPRDSGAVAQIWATAVSWRARVEAAGVHRASPRIARCARGRPAAPREPHPRISPPRRARATPLFPFRLAAQLNLAPARPPPNLRTVAQGESFESFSGEPWTLCMRRGQGKAAEDKVDIVLPAGASYIITGSAQGRTEHCLAGKVAHQRCACCWRHGVQTDRHGLVTRQSITMRVFARWNSDGVQLNGGSKAVVAQQGAAKQPEPARAPPVQLPHT